MGPVCVTKGAYIGTVESANARLIALAPELLELCKRALDFIHTMPYEPSNAPSTRLQDALVDIIAKAEGKA